MIKKTPIETVVILPTKEMPFEVFNELYRISSFMETMHRLDDGRVVWDEDAAHLVEADAPRIKYELLQEGFFDFMETPLGFELPKEIVEKMENMQSC